MPKLLLAFIFLANAAAFSSPSHSLFENPDITTEYSALLQEKNARNDSLLPALDGDKAFAELLRQNPNFWSLERLDKEGEMLTKLKAKIVYIDGIREEAYCKLDKNASQAGEWHLEIGVDFVSAASNTVGIHVQQCLNLVRDELGYLVKKGDKIALMGCTGRCYGSHLHLGVYLGRPYEGGVPVDPCKTLFSC